MAYASNSGMALVFGGDNFFPLEDTQATVHCADEEFSVWRECQGVGIFMRMVS